MTAIATKVDRTSSGLRGVLFDALDDLRAGKMTPRNAAAVASLASQIVNVSKLEMIYDRFGDKNREPEHQRGPASIRLG